MRTPTLVITLALASFAQAADTNHLIRLYEEEILAHDLYVELGKVHPEIRPFQNIRHSEARHREAMAGILQAEGITVPKPPDGRRFASKGLDRLYRQWLKEGRKSPVDACRVGVRLEDHDIADLRAAQRDFPKHREVLAQLEAASNNHLRAFHRNLTMRDGSYKPEALPAADFTTIVEGEMQRGACGGERGKCDAACKGPNRAEGGCGPRAGTGKGRGGPRAGNGQGRGRGPQGRQGRGSNR